MPAAGGPGERSPITGAGRCRSRHVCHAEAIRLHKETLSIVRSLPEGKDRDSQELAVLEAMAAPLTATFGYSSRSSSRRSNARSTWRNHLAPGLEAHRPGRAVCVAVRPGPHCRRVSDGQPRTDASRPESELSGPAHFMVGGPAVSLGCPRRAAPSRARHPSGERCALAEHRHPADVHGTAWAAHAHWLLVTTPTPCPAATTLSSSPARSTPVQPGRSPGLRRHHPPGPPRHLRAEGHRQRAARAVRTVRLRLLPRLGLVSTAGPAWMSRARPGRRGISN